jgi:hypothetical protein
MIPSRTHQPVATAAIENSATAAWLNLGARASMTSRSS